MMNTKTFSMLIMKKKNDSTYIFELSDSDFCAPSSVVLTKFFKRDELSGYFLIVNAKKRTSDLSQNVDLDSGSRTS